MVVGAKLKEASFIHFCNPEEYLEELSAELQDDGRLKWKERQKSERVKKKAIEENENKKRRSDG